MEFLQFSKAISLVAAASFLLLTFWKLLSCCWIIPILNYKKIRRNGFGGPTPSFPLGNSSDMRKRLNGDSSVALPSMVTHDIHSTVFPYYARWQKSHGKVFVYWLGTEPFLYIAEPEFLKQMSAGVMGKSWGKPKVFKHDREPMFGNGLLMVEGNEWVSHRHIITPAFSPANLKGMASAMVESSTKMLDRWMAFVNSGRPEIEAEGEIMSMAGDIVAKASFGLDNENGRKVFEKLKAMQISLFKFNRAVGVPFSKFLHLKHTLEARRLGKEIDALLLSIIDDRKKSNGSPKEDLLGRLLEENQGADGRQGKRLTTRELVDQCKTFFFAGYETTALAITWTLLLLAMHPRWQSELREEIKQVMGDDGEVDAAKLPGLKKMGWVMNEVLRLYSPAPNVQRQARNDIRVDGAVIPNGTNMWIDVVSMHHDQDLWGDDVYEFRPERFKDDIYGGCKHKMGFLPFGFGGRMCVGRNLSMMEYKIVITLILSRFSFSLSPNYHHSPSILLSLRPSHGIPLILHPL